MKKEYAIMIYKNNKKIAGIKVEVDDEYMAHIHFSAIERLLIKLRDEVGIKYEIEEVFP